MYGFAGRSFNFMGDVGKIYNIISTQTLQVRGPSFGHISCSDAVLVRL